MKKLAYLLIAVLLLSAQGYGAYADPAAWRWTMGTYASSQITGNGLECGVRSEASDGYDSLDMMTGLNGVNAGTYHSSQTDGWTGSPGFYWSDIAAPIPLIPGRSRTWTIYLWAHPVLSPNTSIIGLNWSYTAWTGPDWFTPPAELLFTLTLTSKPVGITEGAVVGTAWELSAQQTGGVRVPIFRTSDGREGYVFDFTATVIPEPSSLLALLAGLGGFGMLLRRRIR